MFGSGTSGIIRIQSVLVLLFGAKELPDLARSMGQGIHGFKAAKKPVGDIIGRASIN